MAKASARTGAPVRVDTEDLAARLRVIAAWRGLSLRDLSDALGVSYGSASNCLNGLSTPPLDFVVSFCAFTGTRVRDVLPFVNDVLPFPGETVALPDSPAEVETYKVRVLNKDLDGFDGYAVVTETRQPR